MQEPVTGPALFLSGEGDLGLLLLGPRLEGPYEFFPLCGLGLVPPNILVGLMMVLGLEAQEGTCQALFLLLGPVLWSKLLLLG